MSEHLPEIPSEQQIAKDGLNLGEMNKLLMKKVEELTLYLIDEHKKNKDQQEQIDQLNKRIELLNNSVSFSRCNVCTIYSG
jgi:thymidylate synthase